MSLYHHNANFVKLLDNERSHPNLKDVSINPDIKIGSCSSLILESKYVFVAVPTQSLRELLGSVEIADSSYIISLSKGVDINSMSYFLHNLKSSS